MKNLKLFLIACLATTQIFPELTSPGNKIPEQGLMFLQKNVSQSIKKELEKHPSPSQTVLDTLVSFAVVFDLEDVIQDLLTKGANPNCLTTTGDNLLSVAIKHTNNPKIILMLLNAGAEPNTKDTYGNTPLHRAILKNNPALVKILLNAGANPNIKEDLFGFTSLHKAVKEDNLEIIKMLLDAGADKNIESKYDGTALKVAKNMYHRNPAIIALLEEPSTTSNSWFF